MLRQRRDLKNRRGKVEMTEEEKWMAVSENDSSCDGKFFYAVKSTGIFCRPSCRSRLPRRDNVIFFDNAAQAQMSGFRPCKRCRPDLLEYYPAKDMAEKVKKLIERFFASKELLYNELRTLSITNSHIVQIFKKEYGVTIREYVDELRLIEAGVKLSETDEPIVDISLSLGFNSLSAFYSFFRKRTGIPPAEYRKNERARRGGL